MQDEGERAVCVTSFYMIAVIQNFSKASRHHSGAAVAWEMLLCMTYFYYFGTMKKKYRYILFVLLLGSGKINYAQQPFLTIYYSVSEKSRDSHSTTRNISVTGTTVAYDVTYTGRKGPGQTDNKTSCVLNNEQVIKIRKAIDERKLNVTDSLIDNSMPDGSILSTTTILITFVNGKKTAKTKVKGGTRGLGSKALYKNSMYLLDLIMGMISKCQ